MFVLGLTGGIGCGKSSVARRLVERGARLVDADVLAREVVEPGTPGLQAVAERFGPDVLQPDGSLDRAQLGARVFADPAERRALEQLLHPRIEARIDEELARARRDDVALVVLDAALLLEMGLHARCDAVWLVECDAEQQVARVVARNGLSPEAARARVDAQWPPEKRRALADQTIDNRGTLGQLDAEIERAWAELQLRIAGAARSEPR